MPLIHKKHLDTIKRSNVSMTAGHLIKNYFELFCLKIGINDMNVEF